MFTILLSGCNINESIDKADENLESNNTFVIVSKELIRYSYYHIVYHKDTNVMYVVSEDGVFELLVDANGQPLIYNKN